MNSIKQTTILMKRDSFLCFRQQRIVVNGEYSFVGCLTGHRSWSLVVLLDRILFADDCACYREIKDIEDTSK